MISDSVIITHVGMVSLTDISSEVERVKLLTGTRYARVGDGKIRSNTHDKDAPLKARDNLDGFCRLTIKKSSNAIDGRHAYVNQVVTDVGQTGAYAFQRTTFDPINNLAQRNKTHKNTRIQDPKKATQERPGTVAVEGTRETIELDS